MSRYRIIHVETGSIDPCCWQAQKRVWLFFWKNLCGRTASATTQANVILLDMAQQMEGKV